MTIPADAEAEYRLYAIEGDVRWLEDHFDQAYHAADPDELLSLAKRLHGLSIRVEARRTLWSQLRGSLARENAA